MSDADAPNPNEASAANAGGYPSDQKAEAAAIAAGTVLVCTPPNADFGDKADIYESATSEKVIGTVPAGEKVTSTGPAEIVGIYVMIPISPIGAVCLRAFQIGSEAPSLKLDSAEFPPQAEAMTPSSAAKARQSAMKSGRRSQSQGGVQFENQVCVNSYTPSDSSEEWDPNSDDASDEQDAPQEMVGTLWKKSPSGLRVFWPFQSRYFRIKNAKLHWWASKDDFMKGPKRSKGVLDMKVNATLLELDNSTRFRLIPEGGRWTDGNFTGVDNGREFVLDATDSEHSPSVWIARLKEHIDYGRSRPTL